MKAGKWFEVEYEDGARLNTPANSAEEAKAKAPKYHKGKVKSVRDLCQDTKINNDLF